jgi:hypothetical protein
MAPLEGKPMTENQKVRKQLRFRIFFWLMDICLIFAGIGLADHLLKVVFGIEFDAKSQPYFAIGVVVITFNFFVPIFLFVSGFMRDEYAELLFQRTISKLAFVVAIGPVVIIISGWVHFLITDTPTLDGPFNFLYSKGNRFELLARLWMSYMLLFVGIFQFLRWRDSR